MEETMNVRRLMSGSLSAAVIVLMSGLSTLATAQSQNGPAMLGDNDAIFIDGKTFKATSGKVKGDAASRIKTSDAQELGQGAIILRAGQKLYIVDAPPRQAGAAAMDEARVNNIRIAYEPPKNPDHEMLYEMLKQRQVLEMLQHMLSPFQFPVELTIKTMGCDGLSDFWFSYDDSVPTVHMCYELLQHIIKTKPEEVTPVLKITPHDAVVGQFLFWSLHEVGHAVFHIFEVPLFGREEDAADEFSVYMLLHFGKDQAHRWVEGAAYAQHQFVTDYKENPEVQKRLEYFSGTHGTPEQRFYNGLCLAYGADPVLFADVAESGFLPKMRADHCEHEYRTFDYAFKTVIRPHIDRQLAKAVMHEMWFPDVPAEQATR
jgi:Putative metallopeptidase